MHGMEEIFMHCILYIERYIKSIRNSFISVTEKKNIIKRIRKRF